MSQRKSFSMTCMKVDIYLNGKSFPTSSHFTVQLARRSQIVVCLYFAEILEKLQIHVNFDIHDLKK